MTKGDVLEIRASCGILQGTNRESQVIDTFLGLGMEVAGGAMGVLADGDAGPGDRWWRLLGRLHPLTVHFPIALAIAAAAVEFVNILRRRQEASPFALPATIFAAIAACFAAWFGWLNADFENATPGNTLFIHRWLGVMGAGGLVVVAVVGLAGRDGSRPRALNGYRWGLLVCACVVGVGAHFGGSMVYGDGYLTKVLFAKASEKTPASPGDGDSSEEATAKTDPSATNASKLAETPPQAARISFRDDVLPILDARCVECHGAEKVKGGLRMDSATALFEGDPEWWSVQPGRPEDSVLLERIELPADDPDAMPPSGDRLTAAQIEVIRTWIADGAVHDGVTPLPDPRETSNVAERIESAPAKIEDALMSSVARLRSRRAMVTPIAQGSVDWEVNASLVDPPFGDADMEDLSGLKSVLIWLQLSRSAVTDSGVESLRGFDRLQRLKLDHTSVGDAIVDTLLSLPALRTVNLYATRITDAGLERLAAHPGLATIYCDQSEVTSAGRAAAAAAHPDVDIVGPEEPKGSD